MTAEPGMWPAEHLQDMTAFGKTHVSLGAVVLSFDLDAKGSPSTPGRQRLSLWTASTGTGGCQLDIRHFSETFYSVLLSELYIVVIPVFERRKLRYREVD